MATQLFTETLVLMHCKNCGVPFGLEEGFMDERKNDHRTWYCPNGHAWHYPGKSEAEKAQAEAERAKRTALRAASPSTGEPTDDKRKENPRGT